MRVVHLRNLLAFLYSNALKDDVCADHFFAAESWEELRGIKPEILDNAERRAHKQMAHITLSRLGKQEWEVIKIVGALLPVLKNFLTGARKELIHQNLRMEVKSLEIATSRPEASTGITFTTTSSDGKSFSKLSEAEFKFLP
jgi:hypothetical protein